MKLLHNYRRRLAALLTVAVLLIAPLGTLPTMAAESRAAVDLTLTAENEVMGVNNDKQVYTLDLVQVGTPTAVNGGSITFTPDTALLPTRLQTGTWEGYSGRIRVSVVQDGTERDIGEYAADRDQTLTLPSERVESITIRLSDTGGEDFAVRGMQLACVLDGVPTKDKLATGASASIAFVDGEVASSLVAPITTDLVTYEILAPTISVSAAQIKYGASGTVSIGNVGVSSLTPADTYSVTLTIPEGMTVTGLSIPNLGRDVDVTALYDSGTMALGIANAAKQFIFGTNSSTGLRQLTVTGTEVPSTSGTIVLFFDNATKLRSEAVVEAFSSTVVYGEEHTAAAVSVSFVLLAAPKPSATPSPVPTDTPLPTAEASPFDTDTQEPAAQDTPDPLVTTDPAMDGTEASPTPDPASEEALAKVERARIALILLGVLTAAVLIALLVIGCCTNSKEAKKTEKGKTKKPPKAKNKK